MSPLNKVAAHWARKIANRTTKKTGVLDSGATSGAGPEEDADELEDTGEKSTKIFMFPDRRTAPATKKMMLRHKLRDGAQEMNIVPGMHSSLISIPKMANAGYTTVLRNNGAEIYDDETTTVTADKPPVLTAPRCPSSGLWRLTLDPDAAATNQPTGMHTGAETANVIFDLPSTRQSFLWYHAAAGFPPKETFLKAVRRGNYATWPKLTTRLIHKYFPDLDKTIRGRIKGQRQGIRSTRVNHVTPYDDDDNNEVHIKIEGAEGHEPVRVQIGKENFIFCRVIDLTKTIHTDQTGAFPHTSIRGNRYIMVGIHLDANYIFVEPMKNRTEGEMMRAYQRMIDRMRRAGLGLREHKLDNEASEAFKECITANGMTYELVPPGNHRRNQAERAIQTFKAHFISILAGVDDKFPLSLWCQLLEPAELTLNLLRQSRITPNISAYAHVHGPHDFMRKPMAPLGCAIHAHVKPDDRRTWDTRSDAGFSLGTSMEHHRCFRVYITRT